MHIFKAGIRHMRRIGHDDDAFDIGNLIGNAFKHRHKGQIGKDKLIFGMVDDIDQLLGKQARIERVIDATNAGNAIPSFNMAVRVPS